MERYRFYHLLSAMKNSGVHSGAQPIMEAKALKDPETACIYATHVMGRWPKGERVIMQRPITAVDYAERVLEARWPEAEPVIMQNGYAAESYALSDLFAARWPEAEPNIFDPKQNRDPSQYFGEYFDDWGFDEVPDCVKPYWIRVFGECAECGEGLPKNEREHWRLNDGYSDDKFCSQRCADRAWESQHESDVAYWVEEAMHEHNEENVTPERIAEALNFVNNRRRYMEGPSEVERALREGGFIPSEDEDEDEDEDD